MGTWNTAINGNDAFLDIYSTFIDRYNQGKYPDEISKQILESYRESFIDEDDKNNSFFALAFAQWETKSTDPIIFNQVKIIIETGKDLEIWKELGADTKTLKKREAVLEKFLSQISIEKDKPKRRVKQKFEFEARKVINISSPDNKKTFVVSQEFANKNYIHTSGLLNWPDGGSGVLYYTNQEKNIDARWLDSHTLEISYDKEIVFTKKENSAYFYGDDVKIKYDIS